jgi:hypothetical protein
MLSKLAAATTVVVPLLAFAAGADSPLKSPDIQQVTRRPSFQQLRASAKSLALSNLKEDTEAFMVVPDVRVDDGTLYVGGCNISGSSLSLPASAEANAFRLLTCLEVYKRELAQLKDPGIDAAARKLEAQIERGLTAGDFSSLKESDIQQQMQRAACAYATKHGLKCDTLLVGPAHIVPVRMSTNPSGGVIKLMRKLAYKQCLGLGICGDNWPWETISGEALLTGTYRYDVRCPSGKQLTGDLDVDKLPLVKDPTGVRPPSATYAFECGGT